MTTPPGSPELRKLVEPFILKGAYPHARQLSESDVERMNPETRNLLVSLRELLQKEHHLAGGDVPKAGSPWAEVREKIRGTAVNILLSDPKLLEIESVQFHAIEKGAIPDPNEEDSRMRYFRQPDWDFACWTCGTTIEAATVSHSVHVRGMHGAGTGEVRNEEIPYCPHCEKKPSSTGIPIYT